MCYLADNILEYGVLEPDINLSGHLHVTMRFNVHNSDISPATNATQRSKVICYHSYDKVFAISFIGL